MQRTILSAMVVVLLLFRISGVVRASEADGFREKAKMIRKQALALAEKGNKEEAERLEMESKKLLEAAERMQGKGKERELHAIHARHGGKVELPPEFRPHAEKLEAAARRIHHIRLAAQNLKMADAHDLAYKLMEKADAMEQELHEGKPRMAAAMQESHHQQGEQLPGVVRELRAEIERLRAEIRELSQKVENH